MPDKVLFSNATWKVTEGGMSTIAGRDDPAFAEISIGFIHTFIGGGPDSYYFWPVHLLEAKKTQKVTSDFMAAWLFAAFMFDPGKIEKAMLLRTMQKAQQHFT